MHAAVAVTAAAGRVTAVPGEGAAIAEETVGLAAHGRGLVVGTESVERAVAGVSSLHRFQLRKSPEGSDFFSTGHEAWPLGQRRENRPSKVAEHIMPAGN